MQKISFPPDITSKLGILEFNALQNEVFAAYAAHPDLLLLATTGSGKTIAYLTALLSRLVPEADGIQAIVIVPVRELAVQVEAVFKKIKTGFKVVACYGGHAREEEMHTLVETPAVIIATPGRLADYIRNRVIDATNVTTLVIDEFDKCLELGFEEEMLEILPVLRSVSSRILVSATDPGEIPNFFAGTTFNRISAEHSAPLAADKLTIEYFQCEDKDKLEPLYSIICMCQKRPVIVFCNFREAVEIVSNFLAERGIENQYYHGAMEQDKRDTAMFKFRSRSVNVLVATDIAARGFDISNIDTIIHYQLPGTEEIFTHRNGRTARMHAIGRAVLLLTPKEYLPPYIDPDVQEVAITATLPPPAEPRWTTIFIAAGKKEKINKVDVVGFLIHKGQLKKDDIGIIEVKDHHTFVAVTRKKAKQVLPLLNGEKIKNQKVKSAIAK